MLDRLVVIKDNTLTVCSETLGTNPIYLSFTPIFSIGSTNQQSTLKLIGSANSYYKSASPNICKRKS